MKKFLFWATVVGASLTGCVNDNEAVLTVEENPQPITFEVASYKASSRADEAATTPQQYGTFPTNRIFGTFGYESDARNGTHTLKIDNKRIGFVGDAATGVWTCLDDTYFWPQGEEAHMDFVSYYPYYTATGGIAPEITHVNNEAQMFNKMSFNGYTVAQVDLLYSDKAHLQTHNYKEFHKAGVPTIFRHALAKLNFKIRNKSISTDEVYTNTDGSQTIKKLYWQVSVENILLTHFYETGSLVLETTSPSEAKTTEWTIPGYNPETDYKVWKPSGNKIQKEWTVTRGQIATETLQPYSTAMDYFVLPQTFDETHALIITYYVSNSIDGGLTYDTPVRREKTIYLSKYNKGVKAWEMGKNITYNIEIDPKGDVINFDPVVDDWGTTVEGTLDI